MKQEEADRRQREQNTKYTTDDFTTGVCKSQQLTWRVSVARSLYFLCSVARSFSNHFSIFGKNAKKATKFLFTAPKSIKCECGLDFLGVENVLILLLNMEK